MRKFNELSLTSALLLAVAVVSSPVFAVAAPNAHANAQSAQTTTITTEDSTAPESRGAEKEAVEHTKLADAKLKTCRKREKAINNVMSRISDRGLKQVDLFTSIATKTETFYTEKGKTLSSYDTLVSDVTAKHDAAQTAVEAVKANSLTFKCDGTDPKGSVASFKGSLKIEIAALKDYKTAVKNLIVGVKSVQGTTSSTDNKTTGGNE